MIVSYLFIALMSISCGTALVLGKREGRWIGCLYLTAAWATYFGRMIDPAWSDPNILVLMVDVALLAGLLIVTLNSKRYWPIWVTGLHLLTVASHFQAIVAGAYGYRIYFALESIWSLPKLICLLIGVLLDWESLRERTLPKRGARRCRDHADHGGVERHAKDGGRARHIP